MRARDWPEGWKRLIWLLRNTGPDESLEAGFLGQVIFSGENDIGALDLGQATSTKPYSREMQKSTNKG